MNIRNLGQVNYQSCWSDMRRFTDSRTADTADELWLCEHPAVYTLGQAGRRSHIHNAGQIPVVQSDRGGQVTYHGPGQIVIYTLLDIRRRRLGIRDLINTLENSAVTVLQFYGITAVARRDAPGVYVDGAKIAALGLRVRKGCCYHGLSFNVDMDLSPFAGIDPCGFQDLQVTSAAQLGLRATGRDLADQLLGEICNNLLIH